VYLRSSKNHAAEIEFDSIPIRRSAELLVFLVFLTRCGIVFN